MTATSHIARLTAVPAPAVPVARLLIGRPVEEAAETLPRLFNLCRAAQSAAIRLALDLPALPADPAEDIARDHLLRLAVILPRHLGMAPLPLDRAVLVDCPAGPDGLEAWLASGRGAAPLIARLAALFAPGAACADLPPVSDATAMTPAAVDNSVAIRNAAHPLMRAAEARWGRGPVWRVLARVIDLSAPLPASRRLADGTALVPAARGQYAIRAGAENGRVTGFARTTPTDHLLAPGGVMDRALATLPDPALAPLVLDILDPCAPVTLEESEDA